jgi:hypothetical protein
VYVLKLALGSSEVLDSLSGGGLYALTLLVGDATAESLNQWKLGSVNLAIPAPSTPAGALSSSDLDAYFGPRPLIAHSFRSAEQRASGFFPFLFTLAIFGCFALLLAALLHTGNLRLSLPSHPSEFLYALIFQGSIAAILASYVLYWLGLNIFQALLLLAICGIVAVFSGTGALRLLHQRAGAKGKVE